MQLLTTLSGQYRRDGGVQNGLCLLAKQVFSSAMLSLASLSRNGFTLFNPTLLTGSKGFLSDLSEGEESHLSTLEAVFRPCNALNCFAVVNNNNKRAHSN